MEWYLVKIGEMHVIQRTDQLARLLSDSNTDSEKQITLWYLNGEEQPKLVRLQTLQLGDPEPADGGWRTYHILHVIDGYDIIDTARFMRWTR